MLLNSYKDRVIDYNSPVKVYRNLNRKGVVYSIVQRGLVVAYGCGFSLRDVSFFVSAAGREKCRQQGKRNVHAYIKGYLTNGQISNKNCLVKYNPYHNKSFIGIEDGKLKDIGNCKSINVLQDGVFANF